MLSVVFVCQAPPCLVPSLKLMFLLSCSGPHLSNRQMHKDPRVSHADDKTRNGFYNVFSFLVCTRLLNALDVFTWRFLKEESVEQFWMMNVTDTTCFKETVDQNVKQQMTCYPHALFIWLWKLWFRTCHNIKGPPSTAARLLCHWVCSHAGMYRNWGTNVPTNLVISFFGH